MKYAIQIVRPGDPQHHWFWGNNITHFNEGPFQSVDEPGVILFDSYVEARDYSDGWFEEGAVRIVTVPLKSTLRGYNSAERKEMPVQTLVAEYFPDALAAVARHSKKANDKHNPGEPMHWARKKSTDHLNCAVRHLMTPDAIDPDTQEIELVGATWRCLAALQLREEKRLVKAGIKPLSGVVDVEA